MARTDRHRPYWVKEKDPYEQRFFWHDQGTPKHGWRKAFWFRDCNCRAWYCCTTKIYRAERRASRHEVHRRCREAIKGNITALD